MEFAFVSGSVALDLAGTRKWRSGQRPEELLTRPEDLERWFDASSAFPPGLRVDEEQFADALLLREAIYRLACDRLASVPFEESSLATLNRCAANPGLQVRLGPDGLQRHGDAAGALADVAREAAAVLSDRDACLKECGRPSCTRVYIDRSRGARRTWCGMDECGNRVKAANYRARKKAAASEA